MVNDLIFVYYEFPWDYDPSTPMDLDDFNLCRASFSGDSVADSLLRGLSSFGYVNYDNYIKSNMEMDVDAILHFTGLDESKSGINGDEHDFIAYIIDMSDNYIFEDERGLSEWKATFRMG